MQPKHSHRSKDREDFSWPSFVEEGYKTKVLDITKNICNVTKDFVIITTVL